ncbi:cytochrome o ubiquinol oxidase subunit I [Acidomonas methanolica]|uniref:Cytochrome oxidase/cytochrome o ubiquinol oxidase subunit I n=1 Tax=Acidomonas methanolica NBRC 104435 TaxID=1231351 RepID=A0A023D4W9_ACIMT|nr:cytochrome o ubiquinol oxidase subunit I [Acidomonas methanolica]MBU2653690.1 cytochrome o ubiquinol oxidase subunit I [Acidomonas methanolica]TCS31642.1 cytochrome bo3 quinol oxidase subunit 1 apoprotein [Acidomonas methanolica]GAJ28856.1 cytochrome oxidase/cytochrome o ubiquinol oxidase subunit I [Acidomonas methanolica NBRC 104435]GBQ45876.1 cytochrome o ubiquinol oxidase subunit I [Acidomonas methanolica]GEK98060.1 cytochrome ubiquinol oxidase subunit I [Acidomonas methanolica NBRC 1044
MLGKLTLSAIPFDVPILVGTFVGVAVVGVAVLGLITYFGKWGYLWREWLTTVDHKRLGVMYIVLALVMLFRGFADALMMRTQLAIAYNGNPGYLPPHHYDQIFSAHGTIMIFFMAMAFMTGLFNVVVPLQIGARDVAFPFLNSVSFWLTTISAVLINVSLFVGEFAQVGWLAYPPISEMQFSPGVGIDYYIWAVQLSGVGTLLTGVNFFTTILKMRAPGMGLMQMPIFTWTAFCASILILAAFPVLTVTLGCLSLDRYLGMHFFTNDGGGNVMLYLNMIWAWGHPEVYILILPAFGVFSEVVPTFSRKPLFGYATMVWATIAITFLSFIVWVHHFFTMGAGPSVNAFFGIMTMIIAVPTGVKIFNWLFTMYKGRIEFNSMMYWVLGFMVTFSIGGMTGVMLAMPAADWVLHNSLFVIAHFHNVIIGGVYFGYVTGLNYWWPKIMGYKMNETWGKRAFFFWFIGFYFAFVPLYIAGFEGMTRRLNHYDNPDWHLQMQIAEIGVLLIACGVVCQLTQIYVSIRDGKLPANRDFTGDIWNGRTLEWSIPSPPPAYNFAVIPTINGLDTFHNEKEQGLGGTDKPLEDIHMPKNTSAGVFIGVFAFLIGFGAIWYIWWLAALGLLGVMATIILRSANLDIDYYVPASEVQRDLDEHSRKLMAQAAE